MNNKNSQKKIKYPIIIIPGVCGSKMIGTDKKTGKSRIVWVHGSLQYAHISSKYLWGKHGSDGIFHSFVEEYADISAKQGLQGVDQMVELKIFQNLTNYFGKLINHLIKNEGYEANKNLFAYSYDWRQDISHKSIQKPLNQLIKAVMTANDNNKVILLTHSMGGLVAEQYMRIHPTEWESQIIHFLALMTPFNGSSGWANISQIIGYNLQLPCPLSTAKGIQANSISPIYLQIRKNAESESENSAFLKEENQLLHTFGQIFIKKVKDNNPLAILKAKIKPENQIQSILCKKVPRNIYQKYQKIQNDDIQINESIYGNKVPDIAFVLAKRIHENPALIHPKEFGLTMKFLQLGCVNGSLTINGLKNPSKQIKEINLFDAQTIKFPERHRLYEWEVYYPWATDLSYTIPYTYEESKYMKIIDNDIHFTQEFFNTLHYFNKQKIIYNSIFQDIKEFAISLQYWHESQNINFVQQELQCGCGCTKRKETSEYMRNKYSYPWSSPASRMNYTPESIETLLNKMHPEGTIENVLFGPNHQMYETTKQYRSIPLKIPKDTKFRFTSICGFGRQTPLHAVFEKPIQRYTELSSQIPKMLQADGDGTVLLTAALSDPFPQEVVNNRILVHNEEHFGFLQQKSSIEMLSSILKTIQAM